MLLHVDAHRGRVYASILMVLCVDCYCMQIFAGVTLILLLCVLTTGIHKLVQCTYQCSLFN